ncbi:ATP synthase F1 subunit delta [Candidatus Parcubacteria bacterium]|nr:ATP synthase F1 subunit delta [Patescibacteria group bacterium]MCG2694045.1 ATP synthase F1 subunit delta [Candidatus Parcubacteria bacterium]
MKNSDKIYALALYGAIEEDDNIDTIINAFLNLLKEKSQLHRINKIIAEFEKVYNQKNDVFQLKIQSAFPLDSQVIDKIADALKIKKYELETEIDKNLIGGFVARYGDTLIDTSIKNNLNKLYNKLIK